MSETFQKKCEGIKKKFTSLSHEEKYLALIEMGKQLPPFPERFKTPDRIVRGCQSTVYLLAAQQEGKIYFEMCADALISAGLAALLIALYSGETAATILTHPPQILTELELGSTLSMGRSNGLMSILLKMKQEALRFV